MRTLIIAFCLGFMPALTIGELVRELYHDPQSQVWTMRTANWTATLKVSDPDDMIAALEVKSSAGEIMAATIDMMGANLPTLMDINQVYICGDEAGVVVTIADLTPRGEYGVFVYRRVVFSLNRGYLGDITDLASSEARGALHAAVVAPDLPVVCN